MQFKNLLRNALDNRLKGKPVRQDPINDDDLEANRRNIGQSSDKQEDTKSGIIIQMFENSKIKSPPSKITDINLNSKDLRQIMYDANSYLKLANEELTHLSRGIGGKRRNKRSTLNINKIQTDKNREASVAPTKLTNEMIKSTYLNKIANEANSRKIMSISSAELPYPKPKKSSKKDFMKINIKNLSKVSKLNMRKFGQK